MPPKIVKRSRSAGAPKGKRVKRALAPIQLLPVELQGRIALFLRYPEEVRMHFLWPKQLLHTPLHIEQRVAEIVSCRFYLHWMEPLDAAKRLAMYKKNTKNFPLRLMNFGARGSVQLFRNDRWKGVGHDDVHLSWDSTDWITHYGHMEKW